MREAASYGVVVGGRASGAADPHLATTSSLLRGLGAILKDFRTIGQVGTEAAKLREIAAPAKVGPAQAHRRQAHCRMIAGLDQEELRAIVSIGDDFPLAVEPEPGQRGVNGRRAVNQRSVVVDEVGRGAPARTLNDNEKNVHDGRWAKESHRAGAERSPGRPKRSEGPALAG